MGIDHNVLDPCQQPALNQDVEVLAAHPDQEARQSSPCVYSALSTGTMVGAEGISRTLERSVQMNGRLRYSSR